MLLTLLLWGYVTFVVFILGLGIMKVIKKATDYQCSDLSIIWLFGIMCATVYAEYYSLLGKVGAFANLLLLLVVIGILFLNWNQLKELIRSTFNGVKQDLPGKRKVIFFILASICFTLCVCLASMKASHADTDLYHAQAIRWIEECGVVKGIGNLHNRLAYNSSFMCLQALFSGSFLLNQSTHVVNGYIACMLMMFSLYSLIRVKKERTLKSSLLFCVIIIFYIGNTAGILSSPNSDTLALLLVLFIFQKWCQLLEENERSTLLYAILCILGVFVVSVKLSTIMILILVLKPVVSIINEKKWKEISFFIALGSLVIAPFLIRNIIISGYLVYPYSSLDFFDVDWKMAKSVVDFDNREIMAYGRNLESYYQSDLSFAEWFPIWWSYQKLWIKGMFVVDIVSSVLYIVFIFKKMIKKNIDIDRILLFLTALIIWGFWIFTAPNIRYGMVFVFLVPTIVIGDIHVKWSEMTARMIYSIGVSAVLIFCTGMMLWVVLDRKEELSLKRPAYYIYRECDEIAFDGIKIYVGKENCYGGYYFFPAIPYEKTLNYIELRGSTLEDGFRVKKEVKDIIFNNSGQVYEPVK